MTRTFSIAGAVLGTALALAVPAFGQAPADAFERAVAAQAPGGADNVYADAFERAVTASRRSTTVLVDVHDRAAGATRSSGQQTFPPDAFERMLLNRAGSTSVALPSDAHGRVAIEASPGSSIATSDRTIEWSQVGVGFGLGALLVIGLALGARIVRPRPLAH